MPSRRKVGSNPSFLRFSFANGARTLMLPPELGKRPNFPRRCAASPRRFHGSFPQVGDPVAQEGTRPIFRLTPRPSYEGGDRSRLRCLFCKPVKPTVLSAARAPRAFAQRKVAIRGRGVQRTRWEKNATRAVATRGSSRLRPLAPGLGVSLNRPRPHQPASRGGARRRDWQ